MEIMDIPPVANPFLLMLDPQQVLQSMERSSSLRSLGHRTCHPLDRPVLRALSVDLMQVDAEIDCEADLLPDEPLADEAGLPGQDLDA